MSIDVEAPEGWDSVQNVRDPAAVVHEWDVHDEETGTMRTNCGRDFFDRDRSPNWVATDDDVTCTSCDEHTAHLMAQGRD